MSKTASAALPGDLLSLQPYGSGRAGAKAGARRFLLEVGDEAASKVLVASLPMLERLLLEKSAEVRERRLGEMVDFMTGQMLTPSAVDVEMAQRLGRCRCWSARSRGSR